MAETCKICQKVYEADADFNRHLKAHKIRVIEYYQQHLPRYDLFDNSIINYKNKEICNVEPQTQLLHPITLKMINLRRQNIPLCLTKFDVDAESKLSSIISFQKCKTNTNNYKK